ncbi:hypothetical protein JOC86_001792 [Bacillus pakistanensis]|uniref:Uncharacterized protein n=1 Tax=Rossellomorea pakistanensis TaxID=992288 RepID=A0ABS2NBQ1_9BACI|nr:hypothetical protein [Bacillus pakistanensis]
MGQDRVYARLHEIYEPGSGYNESKKRFMSLVKLYEHGPELYKLNLKIYKLKVSRTSIKVIATTISKSL